MPMGEQSGSSSHQAAYHPLPSGNQSRLSWGAPRAAYIVPLSKSVTHHSLACNVEY
jgi:hypothetical protein